MKKIIIFSVIVIAAGGVFLLSSRDIPAPQHPVEKVLNNETIFK